MKRPPKERNKCSACGAAIKWAHFSDGVRPIESCDEGEGTVAIQAPLPGIDGKTFALFVSGVRTSYRLHLESCTHAAAFRSRWKTKITCRGCSVPMAALEGGRTVCRNCQRVEASKLDELAGLLVERFGFSRSARPRNRGPPAHAAGAAAAARAARREGLQLPAPRKGPPRMTVHLFSVVNPVSDLPVSLPSGRRELSTKGGAAMHPITKSAHDSAPRPQGGGLGGLGSSLVSSRLLPISWSIDRPQRSEKIGSPKLTRVVAKNSQGLDPQQIALKIGKDQNAKRGGRSIADLCPIFGSISPRSLTRSVGGISATRGASWTRL